MSFVRSAPLFALLHLVACTDPVIGRWQMEPVYAVFDGIRCDFEGYMIVGEQLRATWDQQIACENGYEGSGSWAGPVSPTEGDITYILDLEFQDGDEDLTLDCERLADDTLLLCDDRDSTDIFRFTR